MQTGVCGFSKKKLDSQNSMSKMEIKIAALNRKRKQAYLTVRPQAGHLSRHSYHLCQK